MSYMIVSPAPHHSIFIVLCYCDLSAAAAKKTSVTKRISPGDTGHTNETPSKQPKMSSLFSKVKRKLILDEGNTPSVADRLEHGHTSDNKVPVVIDDVNMCDTSYSVSSDVIIVGTSKVDTGDESDSLPDLD